jgi:predicted RNA-binding protein with PIN domain
MLQNLFGDVALDVTIKSLLQKFGRFSFTQRSALIVAFDAQAQPVTISSGTVTTVTTVTTSNTGYGDIGKNGTAILASTNNFHSSVGKNFIRS